MAAKMLAANPCAPHLYATEEALTSTSRHQHKHIFPCKGCIDGLLLIGPEGLGAKISIQDVFQLITPGKGGVPALVYQTIMLVTCRKALWLPRCTSTQHRVWFRHTHVIPRGWVWYIVSKAAATSICCGALTLLLLSPRVATGGCCVPNICQGAAVCPQG